MKMNKGKYKKEKATLPKEYEDYTKQLQGKLESNYLMDKVNMMTYYKDGYDNQIKTLHKRLGDMYVLKWTDMQKKHSKLEKQLMGVAQHSDQNLKGQLSEKKSDL